MWWIKPLPGFSKPWENKKKRSVKISTPAGLAPEEFEAYVRGERRGADARLTVAPLS